MVEAVYSKSLAMLKKSSRWARNPDWGYAPGGQEMLEIQVTEQLLLVWQMRLKKMFL
jgi:hypothetical protein